MGNSNGKLVAVGGILFDICLTIAFFIFMMEQCRSFVPIEQEFANTILAALTAVPISGTFWLALQCLRVTLVDQLRRRKRRPS